MNRPVFEKKITGRSRLLPESRGFTLVEIITVLILISIVGVVIVSQSTDTSADLAAETAMLKSHLRYAQIRSMNSNDTWGITISGNSYTLTQNGSASTTLLPGTSSNTRTLAAGLTITPATITFDEWGSPGSTTITVTISDGSSNRIITITRNTGFIP